MLRGTDRADGVLDMGTLWQRAPGDRPGLARPRRGSSGEAMTSGESIDKETAGQGLEPAARWKLIGPGILVAGTEVGAGDLVATLSAGASFGYALLWAVALGTVLTIALVEGAGRYVLGVTADVALGTCALLFLVVGANELYKAVAGVV